MNTFVRLVSIAVVSVVIASAGYAESLPRINVTVTNEAGKVVYKGTTNASGAFATGKLEPGNYVVQFVSSKAGAKNAKYSLVMTDGKDNVSADSVAGEKFADPGVAMKLALSSKVAVTGQVGPAGSHPASAQAAATGASKDNRRVKIINGKRYVWVLPNTGSVSGGQWVEESEADAATNKTKVLQNNRPAQSGMYH